MWPQALSSWRCSCSRVRSGTVTGRCATLSVLSHSDRAAGSRPETSRWPGRCSWPAAGLARAGGPAASRPAPALIGAAGAGLIGSAVFTTDPVSGYPPGTPDALTRPTRTGIAHNLAAVPVFAGLPAAALASGWRAWRAGQHRFGMYSAGTAVTMLTTMALAGAGFAQSPRLNGLGGLFQRASIITGFAWLTALSAQALRRPPTTAAPRHEAG